MENENYTEEQKKTFDFKAFAFKCLNYWYLFVIALVIAVGYSYYKVRYYVPQYSVDARIMVKDEFSSWGQEYFLPGMELVSERSRLVNEIGSFRSFPLMRKVIDQLPSFKVSYFDHGNIKVTELYKISPFRIVTDSTDIDGLKGVSLYLKVNSAEEFELSKNENYDPSITQRFGETFLYNGKKIMIELEERPTKTMLSKKFSFSINDPDYLARFYQNSISISLEDKASSIIVIGKTGTEIQKEIDFINQLIETYIQDGVERSNQIASKTIKFVDGQINRILDTLILAEEQLQRFKSNVNVQRIPLEEYDFISELTELERNKIESLLRIDFYNEVLKTLNEDSFTEIVVPEFISNVAISARLVELNKLYNDILLADFNLTKENSKMRQMREVIENSKKEIGNSLELELKVEKAKLNSIEKSIARLESKVQSIPEAERNYVNIKRTYQLNSDLYTFLLQKKSEASIAKASNISKVQVLDYASRLRVRYTGLNSSKLYITSIATAILIPLLLIFLMDLLNTKIIDRKDLQSYTKIPIIGVIGHNQMQNNLVIFNSPRSIIAESFRTIRTQINFLGSKKDSLVILLTSSVSGEGKTFCSINLASAYSSLDKKTILVGADLRRPKIYDDFNIENESGLSDVLAGQKSLDEVIFKTDFDNVHLLTSGPIPPNPSELLDKVEMADLINELRKRYEIVIIDTPPVGLVSDALLLQKYVDVNLYLVRQRYTRKNHLDIINDYHDKGLISNIGIVVNDVKQRKIGYGGYYGYGYGYGYGYAKEYS